MMLVVETDVDFINLQPPRPSMGITDDYPVIKMPLAKTEDVNVLGSHHRPNVFLLIIQVVLPHESFRTI